MRLVIDPEIDQRISKNIGGDIWEEFKQFIISKQEDLKRETVWEKSYRIPETIRTLKWRPYGNTYRAMVMFVGDEAHLFFVADHKMYEKKLKELEKKKKIQSQKRQVKSDTVPDALEDESGTEKQDDLIVLEPKNEDFIDDGECEVYYEGDHDGNLDLDSLF